MQKAERIITTAFTWMKKSLETFKGCPYKHPSLIVQALSVFIITPY